MKKALLTLAIIVVSATNAFAASSNTVSVRIVVPQRIEMSASGQVNKFASTSTETAYRNGRMLALNTQTVR